MSTAGNFFEVERKAFKLRTKILTTSSTNTTYTTRAGGASDNFIIDRVIQVTTTSGNSMDITVSNGVYPGQQLLVVTVSHAGGAETVTTDVDTGDDGTGISTTGSWSLLMWIDDTNGWVELATGT